jgi:hypothetical protein
MDQRTWVLEVYTVGIGWEVKGVFQTLASVVRSYRIEAPRHPWCHTAFAIRPAQ